MKQQFTDKEIEELCDLYSNHAKDFEYSEIINFLKRKFNFSNTHTIIIELRKEFENQRHIEMWDKHRERYKNSTLSNTLLKRIDYMENGNKKN
jgi:hypothetical protein